MMDNQIIVYTLLNCFLEHSPNGFFITLCAYFSICKFPNFATNSQFVLYLSLSILRFKSTNTFKILLFFRLVILSGSENSILSIKFSILLIPILILCLVISYFIYLTIPKTKYLSEFI